MSLREHTETNLENLFQSLVLLDLLLRVPSRLSDFTTTQRKVWQPTHDLRPQLRTFQTDTTVSSETSPNTSENLPFDDR